MTKPTYEVCSFAYYMNGALTHLRLAISDLTAAVNKAPNIALAEGVMQCIYQMLPLRWKVSDILKNQITIEMTKCEHLGGEYVKPTDAITEVAGDY